VFLSDDAPATLEGWGQAQATGNGTFAVGGAKGRYVLVWLTTLPAAEDGYRLDVSEIEIA
jgi:hypothetical protein